MASKYPIKTPRLKRQKVPQFDRETICESATGFPPEKFLFELRRFIGETNKFRGTLREKLFVPGRSGKHKDVPENDLEHTGQLAFAVYYLSPRFKLKYRMAVLFEEALVHDLVELHAKDTAVFGGPPGEKESKVAREAAALKRLAKDWGHQAPWIIAAMRRYKRQETPESRFIYALDKILPVLNNIEDQGRSWKEQKVTFHMLDSEKSPKVRCSPLIAEIYDRAIRPYLEKNQSWLFYQPPPSPDYRNPLGRAGGKRAQKPLSFRSPD